MAEVAEILRVSTKTVFRWRVAGTLPTVTLIGPGGRGMCRIPASAVAEMLHRDALTHDAVERATAELARYVALRQAEGRSAVCPRCAIRDVDAGSRFGWCVHCTVDRQIEDDERREREKARQRRWWNENGPQWRAERKAKAREAKEAASA